MAKKSNILTTLGAQGHSLEEREVNGYYATEPIAVEKLLEKENFSNAIWECACGEGHISKELIKNNYFVFSSDLINRGYGDFPVDFLKQDKKWNGDIITNPPYKYALEFVKKSLDIIYSGNKVAMFLKLQFLEGQKRKKFFKKNPPKKVLVFSKRVNCAKNGEFEKYPSSAVAYAWFIWEKGFNGKTIIDWI